MHVSQMLEQIHARMQVKLARQGISPDRKSLEDVCMTIACLAKDPDGLMLHISPPPAAEHATVEEGFVLASQDFDEEIVALRALIACLEDEMREDVQVWVQSGELSPALAANAVRELVLAQFVSPDGIHGDDNG